MTRLNYLMNELVAEKPEEKRSIGGILKDAGKQIGVSLLILAIAFFAMNAGAYYQIAKSKINKLLGIETQSELTKVVEAETKTEKLTKDDEHAKLFLEEAFWLLKNNQSDHANHPISFLVNYIKTGKKEICKNKF